jgi:cell division septation protein DedD
MASSSRRSAGDRVLESKHVIGLFLLMLVFSGIFFTLGYVMGRNQYDGQVRASGSASPSDPVLKRSDATAQNPSRKNVPAGVPSNEADPALKSDPSWEFSENNQPARPEPRLEAPPKNISPVPSAKTVAPKTASPQAATPLAPSARPGKSNLNAPLIPSGAIVLQVAALVKQDDALAIAGNLQKKHFAAYVQTPQKDKFYRVQVGPFKDKKAADAAKKGLENEGFKAFYAVH